MQNGKSDETAGPRSSHDGPVRPWHVSIAPGRAGRPGLHAQGDGAQFRERVAAEGQAPGAVRWRRPPWVIDEQSITLKFGKPENAGEYLKKLFAFAFGIRKDGLISLPGQYDSEPSAAVLADLQAGFTLTFLQHGRVRALAKEPTTVTYDPEGEGVPGVVVQYKACSCFKHQNGWEEFIDKNGCLHSQA